MVDVPKISKGDIVHKVVKGGLSAIPYAGGLAAEFFDLVIKPPLSKRLDAWMQDVAEGLKGLEERVKGFKFESLSNNEMFISTVMQATQSAIRNHQKEKLDALRNAVLNAALPGAAKDYLQMIFLNFIDTLSPAHLKMLKLLQKSKGLAHYRIPKDATEKFFYGIPPEIIDESFPAIREDPDILEAIVDDLDIKQLITHESKYGSLTRTSSFGDSFLKFITLPIDEKPKK